MRDRGETLAQFTNHVTVPVSRYMYGDLTAIYLGQWQGILSIFSPDLGPCVCCKTSDLSRPSHSEALCEQTTSDNKPGH